MFILLYTVRCLPKTRFYIMSVFQISIKCHINEVGRQCTSAWKIHVFDSINSNMRSILSLCINRPGNHEQTLWFGKITLGGSTWPCYIVYFCFIYNAFNNEILLLISELYWRKNKILHKFVVQKDTVGCSCNKWKILLGMW